ncbi:hypothetical protein ACQP2K_30640 [Microbispora siamensis]
MSRNDSESLLGDVAELLDPDALVRFFGDWRKLQNAINADYRGPADAARVYRLHANARQAIGDATAPAWHALADAAQLEAAMPEFEAGL